ncbi:MAG TPA: hypothetical protein VLA32_05545 [Anaerolineales bacterium]|jgi:hypothetical protein|nr:hypothetical protein [Anaerolineales bacterium]
MKNDKLHTIEIETLSAYLDHELSEREETQLRDRLAHDAELREKLEDLRLTRYTLRHTPKVKRSRSFTLSPEMVRKQTVAWRAINISRLVSAAASVLFSFMIIGEILFSGSGGLLAANMAEDSVMVDSSEEVGIPMSMQEADDNLMEESAEEPMIAAESAPVEEPAADEPAEDVAGDTAESTPTVSGIGGGEPVATQSLEVAEAELEGTPEPGAGGGEPPTEPPLPAEATDEEERTMPSQKAMGEIGLAEDGMAEDMTMADDSAEAAPVEKFEETGPTEEGTRESIPWIRWIQGGLLVLAICFGAAAIYFRRMVR